MHHKELSLAARGLITGSLLVFSSGCVTQLITTPVQVANQTTQTAAQTAGQAAQTVIPDSDSDSFSGATSSALQAPVTQRFHLEYALDTNETANPGLTTKKLNRSNR